MPTRINSEIRAIVVRQHNKGDSATAIRNQLQPLGYQLSNKAIFRLIKTWGARTSTVRENPRCGRPQTVPPNKRDEVNRFVNLNMILNNELTSYQLQCLISRALDLNLTDKEVRTIRRNLGWRHGNVKYAQMVRDVNKVKRVDFCQRAIQERWTFEDFVFSDECTVQLEQNGKKCYYQNGDKTMIIKSRAKHPAKVHVWAGISAKGATSVVMFDGAERMNSEMYVEIIEAAYLPFHHDVYGSGSKLVEDNCPIHKSRYTKQKMQEFGVETIDWPPESPDINCIELVWAALKKHLREVVKPINKTELTDGIKLFWSEKMTVEQCKKYVNHVHKVLPEVILQNGGPTKY